ncbi:MAG: ribonuclease P protein component [Rhodobacteraceae bacterium]|nr:ribonuclease P protein component [Paracoccaceae bacterium]
MKPPEATQGSPTGAGDPPPAVFACPGSKLETLRKRSDFLALNHTLRWGTKGFLLQARPRDDGSTTLRVGFTCSKKVGNAVARNRAKRRLREIARLGLPELGRAGWDYCLIGKAQVTATRSFTQMQDDLRYALHKVHKKADT